MVIFIEVESGMVRMMGRTNLTERAVWDSDIGFEKTEGLKNLYK